MKNENLPQESSIRRDCKPTRIGEIMQTHADELIYPIGRIVKKEGGSK